MELKSHAFTDNGEIPEKYTCDGLNVNPPLEISDIPEDTISLCIIVEDIDSTYGNFGHWLIWNIEPEITEIMEDDLPENAIEGQNDFKENFYSGPCPQNGEHRYVFKLYALNSKLSIPESTTKDILEESLEGHIIEETEIIGLYKRH